MATFLTAVRWSFIDSLDLHFPDDHVCQFFHAFAGYLYFFFFLRKILIIGPFMDWVTFYSVVSFVNSLYILDSSALDG